MMKLEVVRSSGGIRTGVVVAALSQALRTSRNQSVDLTQREQL